MGIFNLKGKNKNLCIDISNSHTAKVMEEKARIEKNAEKVDFLITLAENMPQYVDTLREIYIGIKYSNPVVDSEVIRIDEEISNKLDNLKMILSRGTLRSDLSLNHNLRDVRELMKERESFE